MAFVNASFLVAKDFSELWNVLANSSASLEHDRITSVLPSANILVAAL